MSLYYCAPCCLPCLVPSTSLVFICFQLVLHIPVLFCILSSHFRLFTSCPCVSHLFDYLHLSLISPLTCLHFPISHSLYISVPFLCSWWVCLCCHMLQFVLCFIFHVSWSLCSYTCLLPVCLPTNLPVSLDLINLQTASASLRVLLLGPTCIPHHNKKLIHFVMTM